MQINLPNLFHKVNMYYGNFNIYTNEHIAQKYIFLNLSTNTISSQLFFHHTLILFVPMEFPIKVETVKSVY